MITNSPISKLLDWAKKWLDNKNIPMPKINSKKIKTNCFNLLYFIVITQNY